MALNPFFLNGTSTEQYLIQDLINEQLKMYGIEVYYIPRKFVKSDNILREVETSQFDDNFVIEAYLDNYDGYAPGSDLMTKFGLRLKNEINLVISKERFEEFIVPLLDGRQTGITKGTITDYDMGIVTRPREGDLIYFPLGERLFEIKRVEHEKPFYQLGRNYVYELQCELYEYQDEEIDTSIEEIDKTVEEEGYITTLTLGPSEQITATSNASIGDGVIGKITLNNDGYSYTSTPIVTISAPSSSDGTRATAVAITSSISGSNFLSIESIRITNGGSGYSTSILPTVTISGGGGSGAQATASVVNGGINEFTITNSGNNYFSNPVVTVPNPAAPGAGSTAIAEAVINSDGSISQIQIVNAGYGYTQQPSVSITAPSTVSTGGTFIYNETVTGSLSNTSAVVRYYNLRTDLDLFNPPGELRVSSVNGKFSPGELIVGSGSSATYILKSYDDDFYEESFDINEEIETEADNILDFTESNPFGEY
jgi:hypothetical protein